MNVTEYTSLINIPDAINDVQSVNLEKIFQEFPYFQSARALHLKSLYNQNSFKYNYALKITAAHTTDRSVLFDFIASDTFTAIQRWLYEKKVTEVLDMTVIDSEIVVKDHIKLEYKINSLTESILTSIKNAALIIESEPLIISKEIETQIPEIDFVEEIITKKLELGKPLKFTKNEKHSFQEWLQLSMIYPVERKEEIVIEEIPSEIDFEKQKQHDLISKFIETSPKISPVKHDVSYSNIIFDPKKADNSYLMTETLARVYLEQKKYQKAIQAYEILILKYPEKSSFFADRILDIRNLQQNNK